jgi:hypothetical protein
MSAHGAALAALRVENPDPSRRVVRGFLDSMTQNANFAENCNDLAGS